MSTRLSGLALLSLVAIAACEGGATTPQEVLVTGVAKVSGDGQSGEVIPPPAGGTALQLSAVAANDPTLLPELLVARIQTAQPVSQRRPVPFGTVVSWEMGLAGVPGPDARCGTPREVVTRPDDSAHVAQGWRKGTLADAPCVARATLYKAAERMQTDSFAARFTPGPPGVGKRHEGRHPDAPHQLLLDPFSVQDAYGNAIPFRIVTVAQDTFVWAEGAAWGTPASRTLHWKDIRGTATLAQEGYFYLVNQAGVRIAWVSYTLLPTQTGMEYTSLSGVKGDF